MKNEAEMIGINIKCALVRAGYTCKSFSEKTRIAQSTLSKNRKRKKRCKS